jgi:hypothetical protein
MLDRSTPNLFDCNPPPQSAEAESPTVELGRPTAPAGERAAHRRFRGSTRGPSRVRAGLLHRVPAWLPRAMRYVPGSIALVLVVSHAFFSGHATPAPAALAAGTQVLAAAPVPAAKTQTTRARPSHSVPVPAPVHTSRPARRPANTRTRTRRPALSSPRESVSASPPPGTTPRASTPPPPARTAAAAPPPAQTRPVQTAPARHPSGGESSSEFGFEQ